MKRARRASTSGSSSTDRPPNGNLWGNWFLREFFADSCQLYASGDGFREDLLDHPCQRSSRLQERDSPSSRQPDDARDMLQGASSELWSALETVGEMTRGAESPAMADKIKPSTGNTCAPARSDGQGRGAGTGDGSSCVGVGAGLKTRPPLAGPADAVARGGGGGGGTRPNDGVGGDVEQRPVIVRVRDLFYFCGIFFFFFVWVFSCFEFLGFGILVFYGFDVRYVLFCFLVAFVETVSLCTYTVGARLSVSF